MSCADLRLAAQQADNQLQDSLQARNVAQIEAGRAADAAAAAQLEADAAKVEAEAAHAAAEAAYLQVQSDAQAAEAAYDAYIACISGN